MKQSFNLQLSQQLSLTPQLKQSLRLLQLPTLDLEQEIQQILESNPLLERVETEMVEADRPSVSELTADNSLPQPIGEATDPSYEIEQTDHLAPEQDLSMNWQESFESRRTQLGSSNTARDNVEFTQFAAEQETLFEHLNWQIQMTTLSDKDMLIARSILRSLDNDGYLISSLAEICAVFDPTLEVEENEVAAALSLVKTLEPIGAGARNLSERLLILLNQLPENSIGLEIARLVVSEHLDLLATRNLAKMKKVLNVSDTTLSDGLALITQLNPRIAQSFSSDNENYVIPDVIVKKVGLRWASELNPENQTKLRVNQTYSDMLNTNLDKEGNEFIQQNLSQAKIFIKGLMSRYDTLQLVSQAIVERQQAFFEHGAEQMQAMVLQNIAESLEMHESTISRAISGKYLLSPRGVFELKYFFSSAVSNTDGATSSSTAIRSLIRKMVDTESKVKPLSDNKIAKELEQQGHIVARRTVAKYRESMQIAPSSQRKSLV
ncbi:MAG: RNA polymerase sigma-54 factor [Cryomorphaceae bacterium]|jgi:RNA polymerase sigma-54 factor